MRRLLLAALLALASPAFGAITLVSTGAVATSNASQTVTITCPATPTVGDVQIVYEVFDGGGTVILPSNGFATAETTETSTRFYYRVIATGAEANPTVATGTSTAWMAVCQSYRGVDTVTPIQSGVGTTNSSGTLLQYPSYTPSVNNETLVFGGRSINSWTSVAAITNFNKDVDSAFNSAVAITVQHWIQTTATAVTQGTTAITGGTSGTNFGILIGLNPKVTVPTYSAAPAVGTRTTSSVPITQTSACTDCTGYGVEQTAGNSAPTCTQIKAGQNGGGTSAFKSFSGAMTASVQFTGTFSSITDGTVKDAYFCMQSTANNDSAVSSIANVYKLPAFTSVPSNSSTSTGGATYNLTLDGAGTVYGVACKRGSTAATVTQVEAGQCTGGASAEASANKAVTAADSLVIGSSLTLPVYDFSIVGTYGSQHEASVHSDAARVLTAPTGKQYVTLASIDTSSFCQDLNATISPAIAVGDVLKIDTATSPSGFTANADKSGVLAVDTACNINYSGDTTRQLVHYDIYDDSVQAYMSGGPANLWFNSQPPLAPATGSVHIYVPLNSPMTPIDETGLCTDQYGEADTISAVSGLPTGLSFSGNTLQGTATVRGINRALVWRCTSNVTGDSADFQ